MVIPQQAQASTSAEWRVDVGDFAEGALILSEITVATASTRRHVVIDAPLAGGVEAVNPELPGVAYGLRGYVHGGATRTEHRDDRALFFVDELPAGAHTFTHVVRATAAGRFVVPPARVEEMYTPETFGRTGARVITIR